jgi:transcriptional regulator of acetoin/glycerol metabolism
LVVEMAPRPDMRPEIARSWQRALACGLRPDAPLDSPAPVPVDRESRLMRAAGPVLTDLATSLDGTSFALMLADREACIVDRRFSDPRLERDLDGIGAVLGNRFTEENTGTNSIATTLELRQGVAVNGPEHFLLPMKRFSCYGQTVLHPVTRAVEAVLQITGPLGQESALWAPIINRAARDIAQRLLVGGRLEEQRMLAAFQEAAHRGERAVVVLGEDIFLSSPAALALLDSADHGLLRELADGASAGIDHRRRMSLAGGEVDVRFHRIPDATGGVLFELRRDAAQRRAVPRRRDNPAWERRMHDMLAEQRARRVSVLIVGEPGSGRTSATAVLAGTEPMIRLDAGDVADVGVRVWLAELAEALATHPGLVAVEGIHLLPLAAAARASQLLRAATAWFALTSGPVAELGAEHAALAATCAARIEIPPLRYRKEELPGLVRTLLDELAPRAAIRVTHPVWDTLRAHSWPANLRELTAVTRHLVERRRSDVVTPDDLPPSLRAGRATRRLSPLEQAEYDTITRTLASSAGNKAHAAQALGISRTTLYNRMRYLGIAR